MNVNFSLKNMEKIIIKGELRTYKVSKPKINSESKSALIIALHGFSGNAQSIENISGLTSLAETLNCYIVYPNGYHTSETNLFYSWNAKFCCGNAFHKNSDDVLFIKELIHFFTSNHNINTNKIVVTGISNGAMMSHRIGIELGNMISAIFPVAGTIGTYDPQTKEKNLFPISSNPIDAILFHGLKDEFVPYNGGKGKRTTHPFLGINESVEYWKEVNKSDDNSKKEYLANGKVIKEEFNSVETFKKVILYTLKEGTHSWPGGSKGLISEGEPVPQEICSVSQIIADYIQEK
jgi:polyhydroxybutyrate depolymerase